MFPNIPTLEYVFKKDAFSVTAFTGSVYTVGQTGGKKSPFSKETDTWTGPMFADIISVDNGKIKHVGRGLIPLALERALQSFPVHP